MCFNLFSNFYYHGLSLTGVNLMYIYMYSINFFSSLHIHVTFCNCIISSKIWTIHVHHYAINMLNRNPTYIVHVQIYVVLKPGWSHDAVLSLTAGGYFGPLARSSFRLQKLILLLFQKAHGLKMKQQKKILCIHFLIIFKKKSL